MFSLRDDEIYQDEMYQDYMNKEMYKKREEALTTLSLIVHPRYVENFAKVLAGAYREEDSQAEKIADEFNLSQSDFFAIEEDIANFERCFYEDLSYVCS